MEHIVTVQAVVTADVFDREMPVIQANIELLDAQIITLDRTPTELDARRIRRAHRRVLAARRTLANTAATRVPGVGA